MAAKNETPPPAPAEAAAPPKKKLGKVILIASIALVVVIALAIAGYFVFAKSHPPEDDEAAAAEDKPKKKKEDKGERKPAYSALEPFTVNLTSDAGDQFLQVSLTLDMVDTAAADKAKIYMAKIRNDVMLHLSGKKPAEVATKEGKQVLAAEIRSIVNAILDPDTAGKKTDKGGGAVKEVLFTSFIIQ
jgi:flagellar FliL protein